MQHVLKVQFSKLPPKEFLFLILFLVWVDKTFSFLSGGTGLLYAVHFHLSYHLVCLSLHSNCHVLEQITIAMHVRPLWSVMLQKTKNFSQIDKIPNHRNANARDARNLSPAGHWATTNPNQSVIDNCTKLVTKRLQCFNTYAFHDAWNQ